MRTPRLPLLLFLAFGLTFAGCEKVSSILEGGGKTLSTDSSGSVTGTDAPAPDVGIPTERKGPITERGYLKGPGDSYSFKVTAGNIDELRLSFQIPGEPADFWVKITAEDEKTLLDDIKLRKGYDIVLLNGGTFHLTVYSRAGEGNWSATYILKVDDKGTDTSGIVDPDSKCTVMENSASGSLDGPGESCEIPIEVDDSLEVTFTYPKDSADFWVEITGPGGGTKIGDHDLAENNVVTLNGTGKFKLTIYSNYGSGNWSATW